MRKELVIKDNKFYTYIDGVAELQDTLDVLYVTAKLMDDYLEYHSLDKGRIIMLELENFTLMINLTDEYVLQSVSVVTTKKNVTREFTKGLEIIDSNRLLGRLSVYPRQAATLIKRAMDTLL